jgi:hypothetical protein
LRNTLAQSVRASGQRNRPAQSCAGALRKYSPF